MCERCCLVYVKNNNKSRQEINIKINKKTKAIEKKEENIKNNKTTK